MNSTVHSSSSASIADIGTILVAVDCEDRSHSLLRSAAALSRRVGGRLVLLHVYEPLTYAPAHSTADQYRDIGSHLQHTAEARLESLRDELRGDPAIAAARLLVAPGFPEDEILSAARQINADLIVLSTHGYRGIRHLLLGSRAERMIRHASCPVLILPPVSGGSKDSQDIVELRPKKAARVVTASLNSSPKEAPHEYQVY